MPLETMKRERSWIALPMRVVDRLGTPLPRGVRWTLGLGALILAGLRFCWIGADFPNFSPWMLDQAKYTDEGWWASAAVRFHTLGQWNLPGDYNPGVAAPVWPLLLSPLFHFTGVNLPAPRLLSVAFSVATLGLVFLLVRRYAGAGGGSAGSLAMVLLASSPFAFAFSRLAILDSFVVFQFCLLLLVACRAETRPLSAMALLATLIPVLVLTKTTAAVLLPAVAWLAWSSLRAGGTSRKRRAQSLALIAAGSAAVAGGYAALVLRLGYGEDWHDFFASNSLPAIAWDQALETVADLLKSCTLIDGILYPLAGAGVALAALRLHRLWRNPLFVSACLAFAGQAAFLFLTQEGYAPRYFLPMLVPVILIVSLATAELRALHPRLSLLAAAPLALGIVLNAATIVSFLRDRSFQLRDAAQSIARRVHAEPRGNPFILGVSAAQISLMTGLPSINDVYGTDSLEGKIAAYPPGWYLAWNGIGPAQLAALSGFRVERVAIYPVFDDDERNRLMLYRLTPRGPGDPR